MREDDLEHEYFDDETGDPIETLIERAFEIPQVRETFDQVRGILDGLGYAIDRVARGKPAMPKMPPQGSPRQPPPPRRPPAAPKEDPRVVLGFPTGLALTRQMVKQRQRALAAIYHPDKQGSDEAMKRLNAAVAELLAGLK